jgi:hypothetical protein
MTLPEWKTQQRGDVWGMGGGGEAIDGSSEAVLHSVYCIKLWLITLDAQ